MKCDPTPLGSWDNHTAHQNCHPRFHNGYRIPQTASSPSSSTRKMIGHSRILKYIMDYKMKTWQHLVVRVLVACLQARVAGDLKRLPWPSLTHNALLSESTMGYWIAVSNSWSVCCHDPAASLLKLLTEDDDVWLLPVRSCCIVWSPYGRHLASESLRRAPTSWRECVAVSIQGSAGELLT